MLWVVLFCNLWQKRKIHLEKDCIRNSIVKSSFTVWTKSLLSSGYISNASKNPGSNHHAQKEESRKTVMGRLWRMTIEPSIFMRKSYQPSCTSLPFEHHCPYEFDLRKKWLEAWRTMCNWSIAFIFTKTITAIKVNTWIMDYGFADEDVMEDEIFVLPEEWVHTITHLFATKENHNWR